MHSNDARTVGEVMTKDPATMPRSASLRETAQTMKQRDIGDVIVVEDRESQRVAGVVTDRDIVVRAVAEGHNPEDVSISDILSADVASVTEDTPIQQAIDLMMSKAVRRLPVVRREQPVGIVSLGDLAVERDPRSALGGISAADPNN